MAPRKSPKSGSPGPRREAKSGGNKNGKKEGLSGSSFFTWFMVIALLGVWTSVAVVWFELVDYEEVLAKAKDFRYNLSEVLQGKLGIYDADGDGDFDVEDAKVLLGLKERSVPEQTTTRDAEEVIQPVKEPHVRAEHKIAEAEPEDEIESLLREVLKSQLEQTSETGEEHMHEGTHFQEEEEEDNEIPEVPAVEEDYNGEVEDEMPDVLERPGTIEEEQASEYQPREPEVDDTDDTYEYHMHVEEGTYEPEGPDDTELKLEDALEHNTGDTELNLEDALEHNTEPLSEGIEERDYVDEHELENEDFIEARDTDDEPLTEHYYENIQAEPVDSTEQRQPVDSTENKADAPDSVTEHFKSDERKHAEDHVATQPHETEVPVRADDYSNDDLVDT